MCDATTVDAIRAALLRLFEGFVLHVYNPEVTSEPAMPEPHWHEPDLASAAGFCLEPRVREQAIESASPTGYEGEVIFPTLHRTTLSRTA